MFTVEIEGQKFLLPHWELDTHDWIVDRSFEMVYAATPTQPFASKLKQFVQSNYARLHAGVHDADNVSEYNDNGTYLSHFYDPDTQENYLGFRYPTAYTRCRDYFSQSLAAFRRGAFDQAAYNLGLALHYQTDVGQPMHAANFTNINPPFGYHSAFEQHVVAWVAANNPPAIRYSDALHFAAPEDFVAEAARRSKPRDAILTSQSALAAWGLPIPTAWDRIVDPVIAAALVDIRDVCSQFIAFWAKEAFASVETGWIHMNLTTTTEANAVANGQFAAFFDSRNAIDPTKQIEQIMFLDVDGHVGHLVAANGAPEHWSSDDLTTAADAPVADGVAFAGFASPGWASAQVEFSGAGGLYEITGASGVPWFSRGLASAPAGTIKALATIDSYTDRIVAYLDAQGDVHSVEVSTSTGQYTSTNLTKVALGFDEQPAPPAAPSVIAGGGFNGDSTIAQAVFFFVGGAGAPSGEIGAFVRNAVEFPTVNSWLYRNMMTDLRLTLPPSDGRNLASTNWHWQNFGFNLVYVGADQHIYEVAFVEGAATVLTDLTMAAGAPTTPVQALTACADGSVRKVVYVDGDGLLHEISLLDGQPWEYSPISAIASPPRAVGPNLGAYMFSSGPSELERVVFVDVDGNLQALHRLSSIFRQSAK